MTLVVDILLWLKGLCVCVSVELYLRDETITYCFKNIIIRNNYDYLHYT